MEQMATTTTPHAADAAERKVAMTSTTIQSEVREFAREYPTPNVQRAIALCESGKLDWTEVHELFRRSLGHALEEVA